MGVTSLRNYILVYYCNVPFLNEFLINFNGFIINKRCSWKTGLVHLTQMVKSLPVWFLVLLDSKGFFLALFFFVWMVFERGFLRSTSCPGTLCPPGWP